MPAQPALPTYHIRPTRGWLNDPNGMTWRDGRWHVFFQHNPEAAVHHRIQWGHASSDDLVHWREHPVAFGPQDGGPDAFGCWTGVFIPGEDEAIVAYSGVVDDSHRSAVCLRHSNDPDLDAWSDPVVVCETPSEAQAPGLKVMRDPFVFTWGGHRWAIQGAGMTDGSPAILLFGCDDLQAWTYEGVWFTDADGSLGSRWPADIWECPQLIEVDGRAVLVVSTQKDGELLDVVAVVGDLTEDAAQPGRPQFRATGAQRLDDGEQCYAPQFVTDAQHPAGLPLHLGWVRQDNVHAHEFDDDPDLVAGCLTLPRRLGVRNGRIIVHREPALGALLDSGRSTTLTGGGPHELPPTCRVLVSDGGRLTGTGGAIEVPAGSGSEVWVDGEVVEVYPGDGGAPRTYRHVGTVTWRLDIETGSAEVTPIDLT